MSDISELFAKDPLRLTKEDRTEIIAYYRDNRAKFLASGQNGRTGGTKTPKAPKAAKPVIDIDLGDLDI